MSGSRTEIGPRTRTHWGLFGPRSLAWTFTLPAGEGPSAALTRLPPAPQIKSDKQQLGSVIYSIQGPGVDEEPQGVFFIDKFSGKVFLNKMLDREKTDRFRVSLSFWSLPPPAQVPPPSCPGPPPSCPGLGMD
jgi:hypothetical protein